MAMTDRSTRRLLVSTISIVVLFLLPINAHTLSCASRLFTLGEAYEEADSIIVGLVTECEEEISSEPYANGGSGCAFDSLEVLKESIRAPDYRGIASSSGCGLSLRVGNQYLLFLDSENRPMRFSATLTGERNLTQISSSYVRILRDFRDGVVRDLSEPWIFGEYEGTCFLSHNVGGNQIKFSRRKANAPELPNQDWTRESANGKTILRSSAYSAGANSTSPVGNVESVVAGDFPEYPVDGPMLSVLFLEMPPAPARQATVTVGTQSWPLYRMETTFSFGDTQTSTIIMHLVGGEVSEKILSAMTKPSDIVVSAVLVNESIVDSEPSREASQPYQGSVIQARPDEAYFGQAIPDAGSSSPKIVSDTARTRSYMTETKPPEPVIRLETRSTQLPTAVENYNACYTGAER